MSTDDKYGLGAALTALGLAAGVILLGQILPANVLAFLPHREGHLAEEIFDGIVCALALPAGIFFFVSAVLSGSAGPDGDQQDPTSQQGDTKGPLTGRN